MTAGSSGISFLLGKWCSSKVDNSASFFSRAKEGALPRGMSYNFSVAAMRVAGRFPK